MVWECDEARGNKSSKSGYENNVEGKRGKRDGWIRLRMI